MQRKYKIQRLSKSFTDCFLHNDICLAASLKDYLVLACRSSIIIMSTNKTDYYGTIDKDQF